MSPIEIIDKLSPECKTQTEIDDMMIAVIYNESERISLQEKAKKKILPKLSSSICSEQILQQELETSLQSEFNENLESCASSAQ